MATNYMYLTSSQVGQQLTNTEGADNNNNGTSTIDYAEELDSPTIFKLVTRSGARPIPHNSGAPSRHFRTGTASSEFTNSVGDSNGARQPAGQSQSQSGVVHRISPAGGATQFLSPFSGRTNIFHKSTTTTTTGQPSLASASSSSYVGREYNTDFGGAKEPPSNSNRLKQDNKRSFHGGVATSKVDDGEFFNMGTSGLGLPITKSRPSGDQPSYSVLHEKPLKDVNDNNDMVLTSSPSQIPILDRPGNRNLVNHVNVRAASSGLERGAATASQTSSYLAAYYQKKAGISSRLTLLAEDGGSSSARASANRFAVARPETARPDIGSSSSGSGSGGGNIFRFTGSPNVYRRDSATIPPKAPAAAAANPSTVRATTNAPAAAAAVVASGGDTTDNVTPHPHPKPISKSATALQPHPHPFLTSSRLLTPANNQQAGISRFSAMVKPKSPMDSNFLPISPYMAMVHKSTQSKLPLGLEVSSGAGAGSLNTDKLSILHTCQQSRVVPIHFIFDNLRKISKIGEGVFGEVYVGHFVESPTIPKIYKVVPIEGDQLVNNECQKRYHEIEPEIVVSRRLNSVRNLAGRNYTEGFAKLNAALVCKGSYPRNLLLAWKKYDKDFGSENDCPCFPTDQEYVVLESDHYGKDVESYKFKNAKQSLSLLIQVAHVLGVGEASIKFEHRDLHWGNILVMATTKPNIRYKLNGEALLVPSTGIKATIIDFTIASVEGSDGKYVFVDLADDEDQFNGDEDYQFEIYRMMRNELRNDWSQFTPKNNIYWLHYLADKMIRRAHYEEAVGFVHKKYLAKLKYLKNIIKSFESCAHFALCYSQEHLLHIDTVDLMP